MRRFVAMLFLEATAVFAQQAPITNVQTALNHLTVIEMAEPVTMAAAGSDAFEIKRHGNRVFVEPVRPNVSTNLFLWTEHGESIYELAPAGEVTTMNVLIAPKPQPRAVSATSGVVNDTEVQKIADLVLSKALLQTEHVSQRDAKPTKNTVSVLIDEVVRAKDSIYIRYHLTNDSQAPYRILDPTVVSIRPAQPPLSLTALVNSQLSDRAVRAMGLGESTGIPIVRSETKSRDIAPGGVGTGVIGIRTTSTQPQLYQFIFGNAGAQTVAATVVL